MDYEKAYKEALEQAKFYYGNCPSESENKKLEKMFPVLKESEDERIRKEIIEFLTDGIWSVKEIGKVRETQKYAKWIAYLEKQKEQKAAEGTAVQKAFVNSKIDYTLEEKCDASDYAEAILPTSVTYGENEEEYKLHKIIEAAFIAGQKKKKEQQLAEWGEEDEKHLNWVIEHFRQSGELYHDLIDWLKSLPERFNLQPKQEWSEEDEKIRETLLNYYEECLDNYSCVEWLNGITYSELCDWLKSFRPQPHWKPSEKQMKVLKAAIVYVESSESNFKWSGSVLESLYNDLKSL